MMDEFDGIVIPFMIAICIALTYLMGALWGAIANSREIKNEACIATYESYKDILQCQKEKEFKDVIFIIKKDR